MAPFLETLEQRSSLSEEERNAILDLPFRPHHVNANQDFVQHGEEVTYSSFVLEGMVGMFGQNRRGERQITAVFVGGDMIDLQTVVVPETFAALQALSASTVLLVPHAALRQAADRFPRIGEAFWRECVFEAAILSEWVAPAVALYITAAYWFTSSTSFANPAITVARSLTDSFAGIAPADAPMFIAAQLLGAVLAAFTARFLFPRS